MEEHRTTISLILPVYHVADYLPRCMESIAAQTRTPDEVILVDDGSADACGPLCDRYAASGIGGAPVRVIHQENAGASAARNTGLKAAKGEWVAFVDPDDWLEPDYCEAALFFAIRSDADLVCFDGWREKGEKRSGWFQYGRDFVTSDKDRLIAMQCRVIFFVPKPGQPDQSLAAPWDKLYRRAFLEKNHLRFPAKLKVLDDMSFNFRTFGCAEKIGYLHRQLYHYCFNEQSVTHIFRPDRPAQDRKAFHYLRCCIDEQERREMQQDSHAWPGYRRRLIAAYVCRIMKSTAIEVRAWLSARLP